MLLENDPFPDPSMDLEFKIVGFILRPQHTPFAVIGEPPSEAMFPPLNAVVTEVAIGAVVVRVGKIATDAVVNEVEVLYPEDVSLQLVFA